MILDLNETEQASVTKSADDRYCRDRALMHILDARGILGSVGARQCESVYLYAAGALLATAYKRDMNGWVIL